MNYAERHKWWGLLGFLTLALGAEAIMGQLAKTLTVQGHTLTWVLSPWSLEPLWTVIYGLAAIAAWIVWTKGGSLKHRLKPCFAFFTQLVLGVTWSLAFFHWQRPFLALAVIVVLGLLALITAYVFYRRSRLAALLFCPYTLGIMYLLILNGWHVWH